VRVFCKKHHPCSPCVGSSYKPDHGMGGNCVVVLVVGGDVYNIFRSSSHADPTRPWLKPRNSPMVKWTSLYSSSSLPVHPTCPGVVVLYCTQPVRAPLQQCLHGTMCAPDREAADHPLDVVAECAFPS
jgi:hypothetical protein